MKNTIGVYQLLILSLVSGRSRLRTVARGVCDDSRLVVSRRQRRLLRRLTVYVHGMSVAAIGIVNGG